MDLLAHSGVHLLETLFFLGLLGSAVVVLLSFYEDVSEFFLSRNNDQPGEQLGKQPRGHTHPGERLQPTGTSAAVPSGFAPGVPAATTGKTARSGTRPDTLPDPGSVTRSITKDKLA